jgi:hypothetical protein
MKIFEKEKHIIRFLHKEKEGFRILKDVRVKPTVKKVRYNNLTYIVDLSNWTYRKGLNFYYCISIDTKQLELLEQIEINDKEKQKRITSSNSLKKKEKKEIDDKQLFLYESETSPEIADDIMFNHIVRDILVATTKPDIKTIAFYIIIGLLIGGLTGYIIAMSIFSAGV